MHVCISVRTYILSNVCVCMCILLFTFIHWRILYLQQWHIFRMRYSNTLRVQINTITLYYTFRHYTHCTCESTTLSTSTAKKCSTPFLKIKITSYPSTHHTHIPCSYDNPDLIITNSDDVNHRPYNT